jgi:septal ring factor EnvC (AmiA/AmiB activator)
VPPFPAPTPILLVWAATNPADFTALVVALGTAAAGYTAFRRLRLDRPKVVEEVAGLASARLRDELDTAWRAVERLRAHEEFLEEQVTSCHASIRELERERDALLKRIEGLERQVAELGAADRDRGHG